MPQLDASTFASQLFWLAVTFLVLYWVLWKVAMPRIANVLQNRRERIDNDLEKAEVLRNEAADVLEAYEKTLANGRGQAQAILREESEKISKNATESQKVLSEQLAKQTADAEARINAAREEALANIRSAGASVTGDEAEEAVNRVLSEDHC